MTPLEPVASEAELTLLLLVFIAVMSLITVVVVLWSGVRQRLNRRACGDALTYEQARRGGRR